MSTESIKTVAVIGAGTMGNGIAHVFARAGFAVILQDVETAISGSRHGNNFQESGPRSEKRKLAEAEKAGVLGRVRATTDGGRYRARILRWKQCLNGST